MRGQCDGSRRILRAERELFGIRRRPRAQAAQQLTPLNGLSPAPS
jgi:hypothetical protein